MHKAQASPLFTVCSYVIKDVFNVKYIDNLTSESPAQTQREMTERTSPAAWGAAHNKLGRKGNAQGERAELQKSFL